MGGITKSFTHADANNISAADLELTNSVRHMAKLNLIAPLIQKRLFAALDAQYTGRRITLKGNTVAGFAVFNVTMLGHLLGSAGKRTVTVRKDVPGQLGNRLLVEDPSEPDSMPIGLISTSDIVLEMAAPGSNWEARRKVK